MDPEVLRRLVNEKLADGRLPLNSIPRAWGGPGNGGDLRCVRDDFTRLEFIMEGISRAPGKKPLQMHVGCLHLWDDERRRGSQAFAPVRP